MPTLEKLKCFKNNAKERSRKIKNYITEKYNKNIFTIHFILTIIMIILLICSLITTNNLHKRIDNLSNRVDATISIINSQEQVKADIDTTSKVKIESDEKNTSTTSNTTSTNTSSKEYTSSTSSTSKPSSTTSSSTKPSTNSTYTNSSTASKPSSAGSTTSAVTSSKESSTVTAGTTTDLDLLACVIYQEAGGNSSCDNCRRRVADIVLNRVADPRFPNTIKEVLTAKNQYGKFYYTGVKWPSRAKNVNEKNAVARAYRIAKEVLNGQHSELYGKGYVWQARFKQGTTQVKCCGEYYGK